MATSNKIRLNLGCASVLLADYINIDMDDLETIKSRYPNIVIDDNYKFIQSDIFNLPFESGTVDEIRCDSLIEHLSFKEEKKFFYYVTKLLRKGGILNLSTPDFEATVKNWLSAEDNWKDFFRDDEKAINQNHWFGTYTYNVNNRWGYITASIFGSQNSVGQFHKNCYTEKKLKSIYLRLGFERTKIERYVWKKDRDNMIRIIGQKK